MWKQSNVGIEIIISKSGKESDKRPVKEKSKRKAKQNRDEKRIERKNQWLLQVGVFHRHLTRRSPDWNQITPLHSHRDLLFKMMIKKRILSGRNNNYDDQCPTKRTSLWTKHTKSFHSNWYKIIRSLKVTVLSATAPASLVANAVYEGAIVSGQVVSQYSSPRPRNGRHTIRIFAIRPVQTQRLQMAGDINGQQRTPNHIINSCMARMTTFAEPATQAMKAYAWKMGYQVNGI